MSQTCHVAQSLKTELEKNHESSSYSINKVKESTIPRCLYGRLLLWNVNWCFKYIARTLLIGTNHVPWAGILPIAGVEQPQ